MVELVCASNRVKSYLTTIVSEGAGSEVEKQKLIKMIGEVSTCENNLIELSEKTTAKEKTGKKKRTPSAFNLFVKDCMSEADIKAFADAPAAMRKCTLKWNENKETLKPKYEEKRREIYE